MRILHAGHGDVGGVDGAEAGTRSRRAHDPRTARRQPLPLHGVSQHRQSGASGRKSDAAHGLSGHAEERDMYDFEYHLPQSVADASSALAKQADGKLLAGGMSLLPALKQRLAQYAALVDLNRVQALQELRRDGDTL